MTKSEHLAAVIQYFRDTAAEYNYNIEQQGYKEDLLQDIGHALELEDLDYHERARLATYEAEVRRERRRHKDAAEELRPIADYISSHARFLNELGQVLGKVRKEEKRHEGRHYNKRALDDGVYKKGKEDSHGSI